MRDLLVTSGITSFLFIKPFLMNAIDMEEFSLLSDSSFLAFLFKAAKGKIQSVSFRYSSPLDEPRSGPSGYRNLLLLLLTVALSVVRLAGV